MRGGGGCQHYREEDRIRKNIVPRKPDLVFIGGISQRDTEYIRECIQVLRPHNINHYFGEEATSEDCLYLNVWAPATARAGADLPVIVFIYGGGSTIGPANAATAERCPG